MQASVSLAAVLGARFDHARTYKTRGRAIPTLNPMTHARPSPSPTATYVHGYDAREQIRLGDQAAVLSTLLHADTHYEPGARVLEVGCGVGAQTRILATRSPLAHFTCVDKSAASIEVAKRELSALGIDSVRFEVADVYDLPFPPRSFDHVFICFLLEHLSESARALACVRNLLVPGGSLTVIEGDHGSALYHPRSGYAQHTIDCLIEAQRLGGGDALVGRRLYPLLEEAGFCEVRVSPRIVYADGARPDWVEGFTRKTFIAMVDGARDRCLELGLTDAARWRRGIEELERSAEPDGTFTYLFYKAHGLRDRAS